MRPPTEARSERDVAAPLPPTPGVLARLEAALVWTNQALVIALMALMAGLVFVNVVTRYVFGFSLNWSEEIARFAMVWVTYLGAGLALREGQHVAIEYLQSLLPRRFQPWARSFVWLVMLVFLAALTVAGFQFSAFAWKQRSPVMGWRMGAVYLAIPFGALLFAIHLLVAARAFITKDVSADELAADTARAAAAALAPAALVPAPDAPPERGDDPVSRRAARRRSTGRASREQDRS